MLLLAGVAAVTVVIGVGTAWAVTTFQFPGRDTLTWLLALPLAIPTYIVAYVYVDLLDACGPVQSALRAIFGLRTAADYWFPSVRSLGGAILLMGFVLYPYVYLAARAMFQTQAAQFAEAARVLGARPFRLALQISLPLARPAIAVGVALALLETLNDIGASEYLGVQTLTLSIFTTWLNRGSLAGAAQIACVMLVFVAGLIALERYGRRGRAFTAMTQQGARFSLAHRAERPCALGRGAGLLRAGRARLPAARGLPALRSRAARPARRLRSGADPPCPHHRRARRRPRPRSCWRSDFPRPRRCAICATRSSAPASMSPASATRSPAPCWRSAC